MLLPIQKKRKTKKHKKHRERDRDRRRKRVRRRATSSTSPESDSSSHSNSSSEANRMTIFQRKVKCAKLSRAFLTFGGQHRPIGRNIRVEGFALVEKRFDRSALVHIVDEGLAVLGYAIFGQRPDSTLEGLIATCLNDLFLVWILYF